MAFLNEINQTTVTTWLANFNDAANNIFQPFQTDIIYLSRKVYEELSNNNEFNIRIYMGLGEDGKPKVIALSSYYLQSGDCLEQGYTDIIIEGKIFELYSDAAISFSTAKSYINNWKANLNQNLFKFGFLIPRPNVIKFFDEDNLTSVRIFFGIDTSGEIKVMMQKPNGGSGDVALNYVRPCPSSCSIDSRMID